MREPQNPERSIPGAGFAKLWAQTLNPEQPKGLGFRVWGVGFTV